MQKEIKILVIAVVIILLSAFITVYWYIGTHEFGPYIIGILEIGGEVDTVDGNITITLSGEYVEDSDCRVTMTNASGGMTSFNADEKTFEMDNNGNKIEWVDYSQDGNVGLGDIIRVNHSNGLEVGTWFVKIIQISSGKAAYDSNAIDVK